MYLGERCAIPGYIRSVPNPVSRKGQRIRPPWMEFDFTLRENVKSYVLENTHTLKVSCTVAVSAKYFVPVA